jgi:hypothetical protein
MRRYVPQVRAARKIYEFGVDITWKNQQRAEPPLRQR